MEKNDINFNRWRDERDREEYNYEMERRRQSNKKHQEMKKDEERREADRLLKLVFKF